MSTSLNSITPEIARRIAYNPWTDDYDCFIAIDGAPEYAIGSAPTEVEAERICREEVYHHYDDNHTPEKAVQFALAEEVAIPCVGPYVVAEVLTFHAMEIDGFLIGFARTPGEAGLTLQELIGEMRRTSDRPLSTGL